MNNKISNIDSSILDDLITGRVEPYIYAFSTNTIPNYLKVGDTYRPVDTRINEWKKLFPNLVKEFSAPARIDNNTIFRDYTVHSFLNIYNSIIQIFYCCIFKKLFRIINDIGICTW